LINTEEVGDEVHSLFEIGPILGGGCIQSLRREVDLGEKDSEARVLDLHQ
jgi:hypothetical protein